MAKRGGKVAAAAKTTAEGAPAAAAAAGDDRLARLRKEMVSEARQKNERPHLSIGKDNLGRHRTCSSSQETAGVQAVIVPSEDPHQSEYAAACFERRQFISRFTVRAASPCCLS